MKNKNGLKIYDNKYDIYAKTDLFGFVAAIILCSATMALLAESFVSVQNEFFVMAVICPVMCMILIVLWDISKNDLPPVVFLAMGIVLCFVFFSKIKSGIIISGNDFLSWLTTVDGKIHLENIWESDDGTWYFSVAVCLVTALSVATGIKKRDILAVVPFVVAVVAGCIIGFLPMGIYSAVFFLAVTVFCVYVRQSESDASHSVKKFFVQIGIIIMCILISVPSILLPESLFDESIAAGYSESKHAEKYHTSDLSMPEGKLKNLPAWKKSDKAALRINMDHPQKMYLKGMIGDVYTGTGWEKFDAQVLSEYEDMFYWIYKYGFFPQTSISAGSKLSGTDSEEYLMKIANISACGEYVFVPYALSESGIIDNTVINSAEIKKSVSGEISYKYHKGSVPEWYMIQSTLSENQDNAEIREYLRYEESYRDFVYKNYLRLTNASIGVMDRIFGTEKKQRTLAEIRKSIFETLEKHLSYDENVVTKSGDNDFFKHFMEQNKSGYSVHYATAAVLMLRYYGVPARYVEGYFLSAEDASGYREGETIILTEENAHAWAEYYLDGIGWLPFEVTPGYVDDEELVMETVVSDTPVYEQNKLKYTPPIEQQDRTPLSNWRDLFAIKKEYIILLIVILVLIFIIRTLRMRSKLRRTLLSAKESEDRESIAVLYAYAMLLSENLKDVSEAMNEEMRRINILARFSNHEISDEMKESMNKYVDDVRLLCRQQWSVFEKIKYRFVKCIYL